MSHKLAQDFQYSPWRRRTGNGSHMRRVSPCRVSSRTSCCGRGRGEKSCGTISAAPWGSASILLISYGYIRLLGKGGISEASRYAILNANYLKTRLEQHYDILYEGENGRVAHEFVLDLREAREKRRNNRGRCAKRLMDYGFHAPTMSWPVTGTLMVEPTRANPWRKWTGSAMR